MAIDDINFIEWLRRFSKNVEGTDKVVYQDKVYTEAELFALYQTLKCTEADVRGYDTFFTIELRGDKYLTLQEVITYVEREIIDTACVICVRHKNYIVGRDVFLYNPNYKKQENVSGKSAEQFLRKTTEE